MKQSKEIRKQYAKKAIKDIAKFLLRKEKWAELKENLYIENLVLRYKCIISKYDEIQTENQALFHKIQKHYHNTNTSSSWEKESNWSLKNIFPERWENQKKFIEEKFIPLLNKDNVLFDMACANGEWTRIVAKQVKEIDGYEYAQSMVDFALKINEEENIQNIHYEQSDATDFHPEKKYDHGMCLGLFTYLEYEPAKKAIHNIAACLHNGGYLITKDTLNDCGEDTVYHFNYKNGYQAIYCSKGKYCQLFKEAGFELVCETDLHHVKMVSDTEDVPFVSWGAIWRKNV